MLRRSWRLRSASATAASTGKPSSNHSNVSSGQWFVGLPSATMTTGTSDSRPTPLSARLRHDFAKSGSLWTSDDCGDMRPSSQIKSASPRPIDAVNIDLRRRICAVRASQPGSDIPGNALVTEFVDATGVMCAAKVGLALTPPARPGRWLGPGACPTPARADQRRYLFGERLVRAGRIRAKVPPELSARSSAGAQAPPHRRRCAHSRCAPPTTCTPHEGRVPRPRPRTLCSARAPRGPAPMLTSAGCGNSNP